MSSRMSVSRAVLFLVLLAMVVSAPHAGQASGRSTAENNDILQENISTNSYAQIGSVYLPFVFSEHCLDFFDDFSDPTSGWWVGEDEWELAEYRDGEYRVVAKEDGYIYFFEAPTCGRTNFTVEVEARWPGQTGYSYGLAFGIQGELEYYYLFEVNSDERFASLYYRTPTGWIEIAPEIFSPAIHRWAAPNHLTVMLDQYVITLAANGTVLGTYGTVGPDSTGGGVGVTIVPYDGVPDTEARFDNFRAAAP